MTTPLEKVLAAVGTGSFQQVLAEQWQGLTEDDKLYLQISLLHE